jgi:hypothetical protein
MMSLPWGVLVFLWLVPGLGLLTTRRLRLAPQDRLVAVAFTGLVLLGLGGQLLHMAGLAPGAWMVLALAATAGWSQRWREVAAWWRWAPSRTLLRLWFIVAAGSLGALALVRTYSGGDWIGDWVGHYHRAHYFLHQNPAELWIFALDPFTARPPLLNLATSALMAQGDDSFAAYQVYTTLISSLVVLPLGRLVIAAGGRRRALALVPLLLLVNPLFMQNATYSWTKLGAAGFVLAGAWFFRRGMSGKTVGGVTSSRGIDPGGEGTPGYISSQLNRSGKYWTLCGLAFSAAVLAHYSSAPYALAAVAAYGWLHRARWKAAAFWTGSLRIALPAVALGLTWIGWAIARQGLAATFTANTSVQQAGQLTAAEQARNFLLNLEHTLLPPPWPGSDMAFLQHGDGLTTLRDHVFVFTQTSLPGMAGFGGLVVLLWLLARKRDAARTWLPGAGLLAAVIVVGVAVHPARMRWGAGHICLQPLALGFAALAIAAVPALPPLVRRLAVLGWLVDAVLGVGLHLAIEHRQVNPAVLALDNGEPLRAMYGLSFGNNAAAKYALGLRLLGDEVPLIAGVGLLALALAAAIRFGRVRAAQARS